MCSFNIFTILFTTFILKVLCFLLDDLIQQTAESIRRGLAIAYKGCDILDELAQRKKS